jgi:hypothetical protein
VPTFDAVRELTRAPQPSAIPVLGEANLDLGRYDQLLASRGRHA